MCKKKHSREAEGFWRSNLNISTLFHRFYSEKWFQKLLRKSRKAEPLNHSHLFFITLHFIFFPRSVFWAYLVSLLNIQLDHSHLIIFCKASLEASPETTYFIELGWTLKIAEIFNLFYMGPKKIHWDISENGSWCKSNDTEVKFWTYTTILSKAAPL